MDKPWKDLIKSWNDLKKSWKDLKKSWTHALQFFPNPSKNKTQDYNMDNLCLLVDAIDEIHVLGFPEAF